MIEGRAAKMTRPFGPCMVLPGLTPTRRQDVSCGAKRYPADYYFSNGKSESQAFLFASVGFY